jgi:hypothetical protein
VDRQSAGNLMTASKHLAVPIGGDARAIEVECRLQ